MNRKTVALSVVIAALAAGWFCDHWRTASRLHSLEFMGMMYRDSVVALSYRVKKLEHPEFELYGQGWPYSDEEFIEWRKSHEPK